MSNPLGVLQAVPWESDSDPGVHEVRLARPRPSRMSIGPDVPDSHRLVEPSTLVDEWRREKPRSSFG
jgi:hypothetical protein